MYEEQLAKIDKIDQQIVELFGLRYELIREIGRLKAESGDRKFRTERIDQVLAHAEELAGMNQLDPEFIRHIYTIMIGYVHEVMTEMRDNLQSR